MISEENEFLSRVIAASITSIVILSLMLYDLRSEYKYKKLGYHNNYDVKKSLLVFEIPVIAIVIYFMFFV